MPFKSQAQARKLAVMAAEGKISEKQFNEFARTTNFDKLPERHKAKKIKK